MKNIEIILLTGIVIAIMLLGPVVQAAGTNGVYSGNRPPGGFIGKKPHGGFIGNKPRNGPMEKPQAMILSIVAGPTKDGNMTFTVPSMGLVGSRGNATLTSFTVPLPGSFDNSSGTGMISMENCKGANRTRSAVSTVAIPVAGTTAIIAIEGFNLTGDAKKGHGMEFNKVVVELPDGTMKSYNLNTPASISGSQSTKTIHIEANQGLTGIMADIFKSGRTFPSDAPPAALKDILSA